MNSYDDPQEGAARYFEREPRPKWLMLLVDGVEVDLAALSPTPQERATMPPAGRFLVVNGKPVT